MEIQRPFYLNELVRKQRNGFVKVITGLRRCGKSYLLRTIFKNHLLANGFMPEQITEIAFDERDNRELGWGLGNVIALSDILIINNSDLDSFREKVRAELEALR